MCALQRVLKKIPFHYNLGYKSILFVSQRTVVYMYTFSQAYENEHKL